MKRCDNCGKGVTKQNKTLLCNVCSGKLHSMLRLKRERTLYEHIQEFNRRVKNG